MCGEGWGCLVEGGLELLHVDKRVSIRVGMRLWVMPVRTNAGRIVDQI